MPVSAALFMFVSMQAFAMTQNTHMVKSAYPNMGTLIMTSTSPFFLGALLNR